MAKKKRDKRSQARREKKRAQRKVRAHTKPQRTRAAVDDTASEDLLSYVETLDTYLVAFVKDDDQAADALGSIAHLVFGEYGGDEDRRRWRAHGPAIMFFLLGAMLPAFPGALFRYYINLMYEDQESVGFHTLLSRGVFGVWEVDDRQRAKLVGGPQPGLTLSGGVVVRPGCVPPSTKYLLGRSISLLGHSYLLAVAAFTRDVEKWRAWQVDPSTPELDKLSYELGALTYHVNGQLPRTSVDSIDTELDEETGDGSGAKTDDPVALWANEKGTPQVQEVRRQLARGVVAHLDPVPVGTRNLYIAIWFHGRIVEFLASNRDPDTLLVPDLAIAMEVTPIEGYTTSVVEEFLVDVEEHDIADTGMTMQSVWCFVGLCPAFLERLLGFLGSQDALVVRSSRGDTLRVPSDRARLAIAVDRVTRTLDSAELRKAPDAYDRIRELFTYAAPQALLDTPLATLPWQRPSTVKRLEKAIREQWMSSGDAHLRVEHLPETRAGFGDLHGVGKVTIDKLTARLEALYEEAYLSPLRAIFETANAKDTAEAFEGLDELTALFGGDEG